MKPLIALVDDDRNILISLEELLKKEDFSIHTYRQSALNGMFRYPPDLAVIDIKMPKMDGYELFKKLRAKIKTPVIFLTSKDQEQDRLKGLMQGVDDYVTKGGNFSKQILIETIKNTLNRGEGVELRGFGTFRTNIQKESIRRNPKTGTKINVPKKRTIKWKMSKDLFKKLNNEKE